MLDFQVLRRAGTTNERLREVFTAVPYAMTDDVTAEMRAKRDKDVALRERWQKRIRQRLYEGTERSLKDYAFYAACDLAVDACPVNKTTLPLILYAQGKINMGECASQLTNLKCADQFLKKNDTTGTMEVDLPKFFEININLCRSGLTRRLAAQSNRYANLWPYYRYEARSTAPVRKLQADVLSSRVDIMADQFDYRHHDIQCMRDMMVYGYSVDFPRASWEIYKQWRKKEVAPELETAEFDIEDYIEKEGVAWVNIHPSSLGWDNSFPLASINSDTGCTWIFAWDVTTYRAIAENGQYFNRESIGFSTGQGSLWGLYGAATSYFDQYYPCTITPPTSTCTTTAFGTDNLAAANDRQNNVGIYGGEQQDMACFKAEYFEKIVPKQWGVGDYPFEVWVRLTVASDETVIYAEIMPSQPAAYGGYNQNDARQLNLSMVHEWMPFQDAMTNLATEMLLLVQQELLTIIGINTDVVTSAEHIKYIRAALGGKQWGTAPLVLEYSLEKLKDLGVNAGSGQALAIHTAGKKEQAITMIFRAMAQLVALMEKMSAMSPAEMGQPAPREISATESNEISATTFSVFSFISDAIDEFRAAKKRIIYESLVACGKGQLRVPVLDRYSPKVIKDAGFEVVEGEEEVFAGPQKRQTVLGTPRNLIHDVIFTSKDGPERMPNGQAAETLVRLVQMITNPLVLQSLKKEKFYEILNEIFRLSGTGVDLNLQLEEGEDNSFGADQVEQLSQVVQQMAELLKQNAADVQKIGAASEQTAEGLDALKKQVLQLAQLVKQDVAAAA